MMICQKWKRKMLLLVRTTHSSDEVKAATDLDEIHISGNADTITPVPAPVGVVSLTGICDDEHINSKAAFLDAISDVIFASSDEIQSCLR